MLNRILFFGTTHVQLLFATLGVLVGLTALCLSAQLMLDLRSLYAEEADLFGPNALVIQKKVTTLSSLGVNATEFTQQDMRELNSKPFITDMAPFQSADFNVGISEVEGDGLPSFYADMFFQSVPDRFIDGTFGQEWNESSQYVPIIVPKDFLMIANYGLAQSQNFNPISEEMLMAARLNIHLKGAGRTGRTKGRIVGFSQKISSILVPASFLTSANSLYGSGRTVPPKRLFITIEDGSYGALEELMNEMNLDIARSVIDRVKMKTIIGVIFGIFGGASLLITLLSLMGFVQYSQLVLNRAAYEIKTLLRIGYAVPLIVRAFMQRLAVVFGLITLLAISVTALVKWTVINTWFSKNGIHLKQSDLLFSILLAFLCFGIFIGTNRWAVKKAVRHLGKAM